MLTLQKPLICGTTQCLFYRNKYWKITNSVVPNFTSSPGGQYDFGVADHQGPPKRPPGQKNACTEGKEHMSVISGKSLLMYVYSQKINVCVKNSIKTGTFSVLSMHKFSLRRSKIYRYIYIDINN